MASACVCGREVGGARLRSLHCGHNCVTSIEMVNDQVFLEQFGGMINNSLHHLLNNNLAMHNENTADELEIMQHSSHHDDHSLHTIFKNKSNCFSIPSLNCQSLNAKFDQINIKVQQLKSKGYEFSAICLQETWLFIKVKFARHMQG